MNKPLWLIYVLLISFPLILQATSCNTVSNCNNSCVNKSVQTKNCIGHTTFIPRSITTNATLELTQSLYHLYNDEHPETPWQIIVKPFYQRTRKDAKVHQFTSNSDQAIVTFAENGSANFNPQWLNLVNVDASNPYASSVIINRVRSTYGAVFTGFFNFDKWACGWWSAVNTAVLTARHTTYQCETQTGGQANLLSSIPTATERILVQNATIADAFYNPELEHARVAKSPLINSQFDDIQWKTGYTALRTQRIVSSLYGVIVFPLSKIWNNEYTFEPRIGHNNWGIGAGLNGDYTCHARQNIHWLFDVKYLWFLPYQETRVHDLTTNGHLSGYLQLVQPQINLTASSLGTSILAFQDNIHPRGEINFWTSLHYERCGWQLECAYNLWYRQSERVEMSKTFPYGVYAISAIGASPAATASTAHVNQSITGSGAGLLVPDTTTTYLSPADISVESAAHPASLSNTIVGSLGYTQQSGCYDIFAAINGGYEFGRHENALNGFLIWLTLGTDF